MLVSHSHHCLRASHLTSTHHTCTSSQTATGAHACVNVSNHAHVIDCVTHMIMSGYTGGADGAVLGACRAVQEAGAAGLGRPDHTVWVQGAVRLDVAVCDLPGVRQAGDDKEDHAEGDAGRAGEAAGKGQAERGKRG